MIQPLVLAAGLGTRMGATKALLPINGSPALTVVLQKIKDVGLRFPIVVLGLDGGEIRRVINLSNCRVVVNENPELGMSGSMRAGLDAISEDATGSLVFHVDMPYVASATLQAVLQAVEDGATLAAPFHQGNRGFPVYFARAHVNSLYTSLQGDSGGRKFLVEHSDILTAVAVSDPGCVFDIDCPADLEAWEGKPLCAIKT